MSTKPSAGAPSTSDEVTWRDALTPLSRASRRRWTACYVLLLIVFAIEMFPNAFQAGPSVDNAELSLLTVIALIIVFGMLRRGTHRIAALDHPALDERDIEARNSAYRIAFPLLVGVVAVVLVLIVALTPSIGREIEISSTASSVEHETLSGWFLGTEALLWLIVWIVLWAVFLPTGVLAWSEPDALDFDERSPAISEPVRDAVLGAGLAAGYILEAIGATGGGALLFGATVALLGGLARRGAGQPMMSRQRKWRVAIGVLLIVVLVGFAFVAQSSIGPAGGEGGLDDGVQRTK